MGRSANKRHTRSGPGYDEAFKAHLGSLLGTAAEDLGIALLQDPPTSIRWNRAKWLGPITDPIPWCNTGTYLAERPSFTFDPLFHAGCYYVQEASSMLLEQAVKACALPDSAIIALDLCAAPGGKTTHLRSLLPTGSLLVANEIDRKRQHVLQENLWKWGAADVVITGSAPHDLAGLPEFFDLILVDAPCSGEGMFRKDPFAREQWSPALVQQCATTQHGILEHAWNALRPGGCLIYSTCTWEAAENEMQLATLVERGAVPVSIPVDQTWGATVSDTSLGVRCYPHLVRGEGFFIAALRKPGSSERSTADAPITTAGSYEALKEWLDPSRNWELLEMEKSLFALDVSWSRTMKALSGSLRILSPGSPVAEPKGAGWKPHPALATSMIRSRDAFPEVALERDDALSFLRGNAVAASGAQGNALATYAGHGLGWLHGAGNRWNNQYPAPWRIRAQHPAAPAVSWAQPSDGNFS